MRTDIRAEIDHAQFRDRPPSTKKSPGCQGEGDRGCLDNHVAGKRGKGVGGIVPGGKTNRVG